MRTSLFALWLIVARAVVDAGGGTAVIMASASLSRHVSRA